jgi:Na+-transporting NADH:ubiquinone oxidoreductase subunit B
MSGDSVWVAGNSSSHLIDGWSAPTALAIAKPNTVLDASAELARHYDFADLFFGNIAGSAGETSKLCVLLGAFWLLFTGVASWRTMAGGVIGLLGASVLLRMALPAAYGGPLTLQPHDHLLVGGFLFGIVFMATDPVSSPETDRGKWIYGAAIGVFTILVRAINPAYPEGTMLSILLLNAFAPTIDHFVVARNIKRRLARQ